jgi:hypothetical protein
MRVSPITIRNQLTSSFRKLGVSRRSEAVFVLLQARQGGELPHSRHLQGEDIFRALKGERVAARRGAAPGARPHR